MLQFNMICLYFTDTKQTKNANNVKSNMEEQNIYPVLGCLAHHKENKENIKQRHMLDIRNFYCQPSSIASRHSSAMSAMMIHCQALTTEQGQRVFVTEEDHANHGRTTPRNGWTGQSLSSLLHIADNKGRCVTIAAKVFGGVSQQRLGIDASQ